jgi:hypothetical protein
MRTRLLLLAVLTTASLAATNAWAIVLEPGDAVAATFDLTAKQPIVQVACPYPDLYDGLRVQLTGTETDQSTPPHPELTGNLDGHIIAYLAYDNRNVVGSLDLTLTDDGGQILYVGGGTFAGEINRQGHVVGRGLLTAVLYEGGVRTDKRLLANVTVDEDLAFYGVTGGFGQPSRDTGYAVETVGTCGGL